MTEIFGDSKYKYVTCWPYLMGVGVESTLNCVDEVSNTVQCLQSQVNKLMIDKAFCDMAVNTPISFISANQTIYERPKKKRLTIYDLDKLIFSNDPIRDYIEAEIVKIEEKYRARLERLEAFKF